MSHSLYHDVLSETAPHTTAPPGNRHRKRKGPDEGVNPNDPPLIRHYEYLQYKAIHSKDHQPRHPGGQVRARRSSPGPIKV